MRNKTIMFMGGAILFVRLAYQYGRDVILIAREERERERTIRYYSEGLGRPLPKGYL